MMENVASMDEDDRGTMSEGVDTYPYQVDAAGSVWPIARDCIGYRGSWFRRRV